MKKFEIQKTIILVSSCFLLLYSILRAIKVPITFDESYTLFNFVKAPFTLLYDNANNHLLNTILLKITTPIFGLSEFSLRIPNLIFHLVFLFFSYKFLKKYYKNYSLVFTFIILNLNAIFLEFFSLARGYGISMGLLMMSLYFFSEVIEKRTYFSREAFFAILSAGLAVTATLNILNFYLSSILVLYLFFILKEINEKYKLNYKHLIFNKLSLFILSVTALLAILLTPAIILMERNNQLFFGGNKNFWEDTVLSLIKSFTYTNYLNENLLNLLQLFVISILIFITSHFLLTVFKRVKNKKFETNTFDFIFLVTFLSAFSTILQSYIFKTPYLIERTALFFLPLFIILLLLSLKDLSSQIRSLIFGILASFMILFFLLVGNLHFAFYWQFEQSSKELFTDIKSFSNNYSEDNCIVTRYIYSSSLKYYLETIPNNIDNLFVLEDKEYSKGCNFYVLYEDDSIPSSKYIQFKEYPSKATLFIKKFD